MPNFAYVARTNAGEERIGILPGASVDHVVEELHRRGLVVLHVGEDALPAAGGGGRIRDFLEKPVITSGVSTRDLALFTRQLSTLFEAGIPLVRGLRGLGHDESNKVLSRAVNQVADTLEEGNSLAEALSRHPRIFNGLYVNMVRAGEGAGTLEEILRELANYLEKVDAIRTQVRSAMTYPIFVLVFALGVTLFLLLKIVPTFEGIYANFDAELPGPTLALIAASRAIRDNALLFASLAVSVFALGWLWVRTPGGEVQKDRVLITMPIFGPIVRKATISRQNRTLGTLLRSGLPVLEALRLTEGAVGNAYLALGLRRVRERVSQGEELTAAFRAAGLMPEMVLQLLATGEESGQLDSMLVKSSDFYDRQVDAAVQGITSLIEPLLIVLVGIIVGIVVVTMFLPIFYLGDTIFQSEF